MGLSDVVSGSGTSGFAQVGFLISFVAFLLIVVWALLRPRSMMLTEASRALSDGASADAATTPKDGPHG